MARRVDLGSVIGPPGPEGKGASNGTQLTNQNLNNYRTEDLCGWYFAGGGNKVTNKPSGVDAFGMWVLRVASGYYQQELHTANTQANKVFIRTYGGTGGWSSWVEKGKDGATGPKGETGATGATGPQGKTGAAGAQGNGWYRYQGTLSTEATSCARSNVKPVGKNLLASDCIVDNNGLVFAVTTSTASSASTVPISYRTSIQGPKGPKGDKGEKGDTGATGATGPKGADGTKIYAQASAPSGVASGTVWIDT